MIRYGAVTEIDYAKGLARVKFDEDDLLSPWLAVSVPKTKDDQHYTMPDEGEHVWVLLDEHGDSGVIGGAIYSQDRTPSENGENLQVVKFKDGTVIKYDRDASQLTVTIEDTEFILEKDGWTIKRGSETLKKLMEDLIDKILALTVTTPNGPSGTPINAADFTAIKQRIPDLMKT